MQPAFPRRRRLILAVIYLGLAAFFAAAFHDRFWVWRQEIAEVRSSFITPEGVNVTSGGAFWIVPAIGFLALGIFQIIPLISRAKRKTA